MRAAVAGMRRTAFEITAAWGEVAQVELDPPALERLPELAAPVPLLTGRYDLDTTQDSARRVAAAFTELALLWIAARSELMPILVHPCRPAGFLGALDQPLIDVDGELSLRPWRESDAEIVRAAFGGPDIQRWHVRRLDSLDEARDWIAMWQARWAQETDASWAIVDRRDDRPVGQVGLRLVSLFEGLAHVSYWVLPEARGAGVAVRAGRAMTGWTFDVLGLHRLSLEHSTANLASCRVATKLGFVLDGTLRGSALHTDGWHDMHVHSRLRTD